MRHRRPSCADERGFGILETVLAVSVMMGVLMMSLAPTMSAYNRLRNAKVISIAQNLGQAQVEEIRALEYSKVGLVGSNPPGVLLANPPDVVVQGLTFQISISVLYAGDITGLAVVPQGGDGVQGFWDAGVNFKSVVVTVASGAAITPIRFETIVSPPNLAAHEGLSNVVVDLVKFEPTESTDWPRVSLIRSGTPITYPDTPDATQPFALLTPTAGTPWVARFAPNMTEAAKADVATGWRIRRATLDAVPPEDRVEVAAAETVTMAVQIYKPVTLTLALRDAGGNAIEGGTVTIQGNNDSMPTTTYNGSGVEDDGVGTWAFNWYDGEPMRPDTYTVNVSVPGWTTDVREIAVPAGYPTTLAHTEVITLAPQVSVNFSMTVSEGRNNYKLPDAIVRIVGPGVDLTLPKTNTAGVVTAPVPVGDYTVTVSSAYGQVEETFVTPIDATNRVFTRTLDAPSNYGTITLLNQPSGWFGYRTASGGGTYSRVTPNSLGQGVVAVSLRTWELVRICSDGQLKSGTFTSLTTSFSNPHRTFNPGTVCS